MERRTQEHANDEAAVVTSDEEISSVEDEKGDSDEWEDADSDGGEVFSKPSLFRRVSSLPGLASRRSLLTLALNRGQNFSFPARHPSRRPSPRREFMAASTMDDGIMMQTSIRPSSASFVTMAIPESVAYSPDTTRQKMLVAELSESLRKDLLWERQEKSITAKALPKRDRKAQSRAVLPHVFDDPGDYHSRGW